MDDEHTGPSISSFTFRKWNPYKLKVAEDEDNSPDNETVCLLCACCPCVSCVDSMFSSMVPEVVDIIEPQPAKMMGLLDNVLSSNDSRTTILRFLGFLVMFFGFMLFFNPLTYLVSWIPFIGSFLAYGIWIVIALSSFLAAVILSLFTIALAWIYYRPLAALGLITGITLMIYLLSTFQSKGVPVSSTTY